MALFDPAHPGELIRETIEGLREETGQSLTLWQKESVNQQVDALPVLPT